MRQTRNGSIETKGRRVVESVLLLIVAFIASSGLSRADSYPINPGIDISHYSFQLSLSDQTDEIRGEAEVTVLFESPDVASIELDLVGRDEATGTGMVVTDVTLDGASVSWKHEHDRMRIEIADPVTIGDRRTYRISYEGVPGDGLIISTNKYGERTFFGDNWPERARHWLPTVDHPSDKAICEFTVIAPSHYQVVANGSLVEESDLADGDRRTTWRSSVPLPTKVMVIGVARFAVQYLDEWDGTSIQSWVYPQDRDAGFFDFAQTERILRFFTSHVGPFPYEKLANVQSKTRYGGMENAGAIFYSEDSIKGTRENEGLLAHEIAHQWFGDSVTEADWHHVWLSEGFATYLTQLYFEHTYGHDRFVNGMRRNRDRYLERNPHTPIIDESIDDPGKLLNVNSYQKGALVLHMLRGVIGDEAFRDGIRHYYARYRDQNALTKDFQQVMEESSDRDLGWFFDQWMNQADHPKYVGTWDYEASTNTLTVTLEQRLPENSLFRVPLDIAIRNDDGSTERIETIDLNEREKTVTFQLDFAPASIILDPNGWVLMEGEITRR